MAEDLKSYRAFIASPSDVSEERQIAEDVIRLTNVELRDTLHVAIDARKWEQFAPVAPSLPSERLQDVLNREVDQANFFILILWKRYGSTEFGHSVSNTEREISTILARYEQQPRLRILTYFRDLPANVDPGDQEIKVRELRERLEKLGLPFRSYQNPEQFRQLLTHDLYGQVLRMRVSTFKYQALRTFWQFGDSDGPHPRVAILYPPTARSSMADGDRSDVWLNRLYAPIAVEDYKALQKIEKQFKLIGFSDYRTFPNLDPPAELPRMNAIWLCLSRNKLGMDQLSTHVHRRFDLPASRKGKRPQVIAWRLRSGETQMVRSPMAAYLKLQRRHMNTSGEYHGQLSKVILKDYAILARLSRAESDPGEDGPLRDYFLGGIRGLGTWGAAWYINREYKQLQKLGPNDRIELLLEVTFREGRILSVQNVSDEPADYFREQLSTETIHAVIKNYLDTHSA